MTATKTRLPAPEQLLLSKMSEAEVAEMIERHIEYYVDTDYGSGQCTWRNPSSSIS
jgi:hypothetical protein